MAENLADVARLSGTWVGVGVGTRTADGQQGAVVWLSADAADWRAVPVPWDRVLSGAAVMPYDDGLLLAANSAAAPEQWALARTGELITVD